MVIIIKMDNITDNVTSINDTITIISSITSSTTSTMTSTTINTDNIENNTPIDTTSINDTITVISSTSINDIITIISSTTSTTTGSTTIASTDICTVDTITRENENPDFIITKDISKRIKIDGISLDELITKINKLEENNKIIKEKLIDLEYAPGGIGFSDAKTHFESIANINKPSK